MKSKYKFLIAGLSCVILYSMVDSNYVEASSSEIIVYTNNNPGI